jgi:hypothetical protein
MIMYFVELIGGTVAIMVIGAWLIGLGGHDDE